MSTRGQLNGSSGCAHLLPAARADVVLHELDGEAVVFDPCTGAVHHFNETTMLVWAALTGNRSAVEIALTFAPPSSANSVSALPLVELAIAELRHKGLLCEEVDASQSEGAFLLEDAPTRAALPPDKSRARLDMSRRELLGNGMTKMLLAAPIISTFFASGAYASGPSASAAFGAGACKNIGYSCTVNGDCCAAAASGCVASTCTA